MIIIDLKIRDGESEEQYLWRIGQLVDSKKVENWKSINNIVNEQLGIDEESYRDESAFRKRYQAAKKFYDEVFSKREPDEYQKELQIQKRELAKERQKLYATKVEYGRDIRQQSRFELFYENIKESIDTLPLPEFYPILNELDSEKEYVLTIADIHAGARFTSENNEYSLDICKYRFQLLLGETIKYVRDKGLSKIKVICLGDSIQGLLRLSDLKLNETSVVEATVFVSRMISQFLNELSAYCNVDYYHTPTSNHSQTRPLGTKASEIASEDVEFVISNYIKDMLNNNNRVSVSLNAGKEYIKVPILDYNSLAMHGHQLKGVSNSLRDLSQLHRTFYDFIFVAHFHGANEIVVGESVVADTEVLVCPSFIGSDPYSDSLHRGSKASCKIFGFDYYKGHTDTYKIVLN